MPITNTCDSCFFAKEKRIVRSCELRNSLILQRTTLIGRLDFWEGGSVWLFIKVGDNKSKETEGSTLLIMIITVQQQATFLPVLSL